MPECADGTGVPGGDPVSEGADPHPSRQQRADHPPAVCSLPACGGHGRFQPAAAWLGAVLHYGNCTHAVKKLRRYVAARVGRYLHRRRGQWLWGYTMYPDQFLHERYGLFAIPLTAPWKQVPVHVRRGTVSESRMRENCTYGVMRGRWKPLSAVVRGRRVRKRVREWLPVPSSALLYPIPTQFQFYAHLSPLYP